MTTADLSSSRFSVVYRIARGKLDSRTVEQQARDISIEQSVEIPADCIPDGHYRNGIVGRVEDITAVPGRDDLFDATISYRGDITGHTVPQFLNVLFGNSSLMDNIRIVDIRFSDDLLRSFKGPAVGGEGIRKLTGVYGRPLACSALKPMGSDIDHLATMAGRFARGGIDLIKDDHGITDQQFHPFKERVKRCAEAVDMANSETGGHTLYFPCVCGRFDQIEEQVRFALGCGIRGILIAPMLVGPDTVRYISDTYGLIIMGHPALTGTFMHDPNHGMTPPVLLGTLFRMLGADISIFPNWGGRFPFTRDDCIGIADALRRPCGTWPAAYPCPAGGMNLDRLDEMKAAYGSDVVLLIGGALMQLSGDLMQSTVEFMRRIRAIYPEQTQPPQEIFSSSCTWTGTPAGRILDLLAFDNYTWSGRPRDVYKTDNGIAFGGITRSELVGRFGEKTRFDLRYFEIEPGGFSSFEKHVHEHVIIGVRGNGLLVKNAREFPVRVHDIAYVGPLESHQLRNKGPEPFGFFCIVDHERDRPVKA